MDTNQKPGLFTTIAVLTLVSGIVNLFWGFIASATALGTIVGVVCLPITILPTILGIFEIIYAAKLLSSQPEPIQPSQTIAILEILTFFIGNLFSMVVGILALIFYNDITVKNYFARLNGTVVIPPMPAAPPAPVAPGPVVEPEILPTPEVPVAPETPESPAKPKRIRKVAGE
ncbi:hypothetical protein ANAEL_04277 [Anaerolineales bacterium]|nr:hypothetical protein ANAEL_04277 [Anaerolineales bacterium]